MIFWLHSTSSLDLAHWPTLDQDEPATGGIPTAGGWPRTPESRVVTPTARLASVSRRGFPPQTSSPSMPSRISQAPLPSPNGETVCSRVSLWGENGTDYTSAGGEGDKSGRDVEIVVSRTLPGLPNAIRLHPTGHTRGAFIIAGRSHLGLSNPWLDADGLL